MQTKDRRSDEKWMHLGKSGEAKSNVVVGGEITLFVFCVQQSWPQDNCQGEKGKLKKKGHHSMEYKNELQFCKF